jgi:hypothetical protein
MHGLPAHGTATDTSFRWCLTPVDGPARVKQAAQAKGAEGVAAGRDKRLVVQRVAQGTQEVIGWLRRVGAVGLRGHNMRHLHRIFYNKLKLGRAAMYKAAVHSRGV